MTTDRTITLTLARSEFDQTTARTLQLTWQQFVTWPHDRRPLKNVGGHPDQDLGFSVAAFALGKCPCDDPPSVDTTGKRRQGCPDHPFNYDEKIGPRGHRRAANVTGVTLLGFDLDKCADGTPLTADAALAAATNIKASGIDAVVWSTHSYDPSLDPPKIGLRVFVLPSRDITREEWERGDRALYRAALRRLGIPSGIGEKPDPRRFWFAPSARDDAPVIAEVFRGMPLDVDVVMAEIPPDPPRPERGLVVGGMTLENALAAWCPGVPVVERGGDRRTAEVECPWADEHSDGRRDAMVFDHDGVLGFKCLHGHCEGRGWREFRKHHDPSYDAEREWIDDPAAAAAAARARHADFDAFIADHVSQTAMGGSEVPAHAPSRLEIDAAIKDAANRLGRGAGADRQRDASLLRKVRGGEPVAELHEDRETRKRMLAHAAIALVRAAPLGTTPDQFIEQLRSSSGDLVDALPEVVAGATTVAAAMPPLLAPARPERPERALQLQSGDEPVDEFVLDQSGPRAGLPTANSGHNFDIALGRLGFRFLYDEFSQRKYLERAGIKIVADEHALKKIPTVIEERFAFYPSKEKFRDHVDVRAYDNRFHPVRDYHDSLIGTHDSTGRIDTWLIRLAGAKDTPYVRAVSRLLLVAAVRRIRQPGAKYDELVILESPTQGTSKSQFVGALCPNPEWFGRKLPFQLGERERMEATAGRWIIEAGELSGQDKRTANEMKDYLSCDEDSARMAYAREAVRAPRQWVPIGTINDSQYLTDPSGNRRYWPVEITRCDITGLRAELDQLWAEAGIAEATGESIRLDESLWDEAAQEQEARRVVHIIEERLRDALSDITGKLKRDDARKIAGVRSVDAKGRPLPTTDEDKRINETMKRMGWAESNNALSFAHVDHGQSKRQRAWVRGDDKQRAVELLIDQSTGAVKEVAVPPAPPAPPMQFGPN